MKKAWLDQDEVKRRHTTESLTLDHLPVRHWFNQAMCGLEEIKDKIYEFSSFQVIWL